VFKINNVGACISVMISYLNKLQFNDTILFKY